GGRRVGSARRPGAGRGLLARQVRGLDRSFGHGGLSSRSVVRSAAYTALHLYHTAKRPDSDHDRRTASLRTRPATSGAGRRPPMETSRCDTPDARTGGCARQGCRRRIAGCVASVTRAASPAHDASYFTRIVKPTLSVAAPAPTSP